MRNLIGPEMVLTALTGAVFWFCSRYPSGAGRDVIVLERLVMLLPFVIVPLAFATVFTPGAKDWWWLGRTVVSTFIALFACAGRAISGFGTGAKGQDVGFLLVTMFGIVLVALATAASGAMILCHTRPAFGEWFRMRRVLGILLTILSALPIGAILAIVIFLGLGVAAAIGKSLK